MIKEEDVVDRAVGCLYGQAVGDALGTTLEFKTAQACWDLYPGGLREIVGGGAFKVLRGQVTDDTELALALADSLVTWKIFEPQQVLEQYKLWAESHPIDIGNATSRALRGGNPDPSTEANGALMRVSPLGVFCWQYGHIRAAGLGSLDAGLTHPNPVCRSASAAYVAAVSGLVKDGDVNNAFKRALLVTRELDSKQVLEDLISAKHGDGHEPDAGGHVRVAFRLAFYHLLHARSFEEALVDTVMRGGDADTNGAIVGALLGAKFGARSIPAGWRSAVKFAQPKRPQRYWPNDLEERALNLLEAGDRR